MTAIMADSNFIDYVKNEEKSGIPAGITGQKPDESSIFSSMKENGVFGNITDENEQDIMDILEDLIAKIKNPDAEKPTLQTMRYPTDDAGINIGDIDFDPSGELPQIIKPSDQEEHPTIRTLRYPTDDANISFGDLSRFDLEK